MARLPRLDLPGIAQHIVQRGNDRQVGTGSGSNTVRLVPHGPCRLIGRGGITVNISADTLSGQFTRDLVGQSVGGIVGLHVQRGFGIDTAVDYGQVAVDAFGNALANVITGETQRRANEYTDRQQQLDARLSGILGTRNAQLQAGLEQRIESDNAAFFGRLQATNDQAVQRLLGQTLTEGQARIDRDIDTRWAAEEARALSAETAARAQAAAVEQARFFAGSRYAGLSDAEFADASAANSLHRGIVEASALARAIDREAEAIQSNPSAPRQSVGTTETVLRQIVGGGAGIIKVGVDGVVGTLGLATDFAGAAMFQLGISNHSFHQESSDHIGALVHGGLEWITSDSPLGQIVDGVKARFDLADQLDSQGQIEDAAAIRAGAVFEVGTAALGVGSLANAGRKRLVAAVGRTAVVANSAARGAVVDANFAQPLIRSDKTFSEIGQQTYSRLSGTPIKTVDDLAAALQRGGISPSQVPLDFVDLVGARLILNTRTSTALRDAGIPKADWFGINRTGQIADLETGTLFDDLARAQLQRNVRYSVPGQTGWPELLVPGGKR